MADKEQRLPSQRAEAPGERGITRKRFLAGGTAVTLAVTVTGLGASRALGQPSNMAPPLTLVKDGESRAVVLVDDDAEEWTSDAADQLVQYVEKATGAVLPTMTEDELRRSGGRINSHTRVYVGGSSGQQARDSENLEDLEHDGFVIVPRGQKRLTIAGPTSRGTWCGVHEFLERYVGVRWLMPTSVGEDVPESSDLTVAREEVRAKPAFYSRVFGMTGRGRGQNFREVREDWSRHNQMFNHVQFNHNLWRLFPPSEYGETNPEFYPILNGERYIPPNDNVSIRWQPSFTADGIVEEAIRKINAFFDENPDRDSYSLAVNDGGGYSESDLENAPEGWSISDVYYDWVNQVAEGVLKKHPDKQFGVLAYSRTESPPPFELNSQVVPFLTDERLLWADPQVRAEGQQMTEDWNEVAENQGWWGYAYGTPYAVPRLSLHQMADNYRFGNDQGVAHLFAELTPNWGEGPKPWVLAKLQWDPDQDVDALAREWYKSAVGTQAASDLEAYYDIWEKFWSEDVLESEWYSPSAGPARNFQDPRYLEAVTEDMVVESRRRLESAVAKSKTEPQKARAELLLRAFEYYEASALSYPKSVNPPADETAALALIEEEADGLERRLQLAEKRLKLIDEFATDPVLIHPREPGDTGLVWSGWNKDIFWGLVDWITREEPDGGAVRERVAELRQEDSGPLREWARLLLAIADGEEEAVVTRNPSFEDGTGGNAAAWVNPTLRRTQELAYTGEFSLLGEDGRSVAFQVSPIESGLFAARVRYYTPPGAGSDGQMRILLNLRDGNGTVGSIRTPFKPVSPPVGEWSTDTILAEIPDEVEQVQFVLVVNGVGEEEKVYLDDAAIYQVKT